LVAPTNDWEGSTLTITPSANGASTLEENALRDPFACLSEDEQNLHIFYVAAGESRLGRATMPIAHFQSLMAGSETVRPSGEIPLVCVLGFSHAGTTLMLRMLSNSPGVGSFNFETGQFLKGVHPKLASFLVDKGRYLEPPVKILEKTPQHSLRISEISSTLPGTRFIFMIRDIRDAAGSQMQRFNNWGKVLSRLDRVVQALKASQALEEVLVVKYENLVSSPEEVLKKVCDHTGLVFSPEMMEFHKSLEPWQGEVPRRESLSEPPPPPKNHARRAFQMTQPLFDGTGQGRLVLSDFQLEELEKLYSSFQSENGYA